MSTGNSLGAVSFGLFAFDAAVVVAGVTLLTTVLGALTAYFAYAEVRARHRVGAGVDDVRPTGEYAQQPRPHDPGPQREHGAASDGSNAWAPSVMWSVPPRSNLPDAASGIAWWNRPDVVRANRWLPGSAAPDVPEPSRARLPDATPVSAWWQQPLLRDATATSLEPRPAEPRPAEPQPNDSSPTDSPLTDSPPKESQRTESQP
jgi:hypothetical protein